MSDPRSAPTFPPTSYADWRARVAAELRADDVEAKLGRELLEGLRIDPLYAADHLAPTVPLPRVTRAPGPWRLWQEVGVPAPAAAALALRGELERRLGGVWLRVDHANVSAAALAPLVAELGPGVELAIDGAHEPVALAATLIAAAVPRGAALRGCLGCDPLGALARRGMLGGTASAQVVAVARWARTHAPQMRAALVSTAPYAAAGADAVQEIAFALATGAEVLRWLLDAGLAGAAAAEQILVRVDVGRDVYLQAAKLRALRLCWSMLLGSMDAADSPLQLNARTSGRTKGHLDPGTDLVRTTVETIAAVLGGADGIVSAPFVDPALELSLGMPLASATQLLLAEEAGLAQVIDPLGGSWYVESLTALLARAAWDLFASIEAGGGMALALVTGVIAQQVAAASERRRAAIAQGRAPIVGVTVHAVAREIPLPHRRPETRSTTVAAHATAHSMPPFAAAAEDPSLVIAAIDAATRGTTLAAIAAALPPGDAPLRAPALPAWRDAEVAHAASEVTA